MKNKLPHPTRFIDELGADIDVEVFPLVETIRNFGFMTISSCQGDPGVIGEGGYYGHVAFLGADPFDQRQVVKFTFDLLRSFFAQMYDDVTLEVSLSEQNGFIGWIRFRNEALTEISTRLSVYFESIYTK
jgi:hypothetical protein